MRGFAMPLMWVAVALLAACSKEDGTRRTPDVANLKKLHRGEQSAIDSYDDAMKKFPSIKAVDLAKLRADHADATERLRARIVTLGGTPDASAGPWGAWAEAVTKGASAFGEDAGLRALQVGEKHGKNEYQDTLKSNDVDSDTKQLIRDVLLPRQEEHVNTLERAIKTN